MVVCYVLSWEFGSNLACGQNERKIMSKSVLEVLTPVLASSNFDDLFEQVAEVQVPEVGIVALFRSRIDAFADLIGYQIVDFLHVLFSEYTLVSGQDSLSRVCYLIPEHFSEMPLLPLGDMEKGASFHQGSFKFVYYGGHLISSTVDDIANGSFLVAVLLK